MQPTELTIDSRDKAILNRLQSNFPITPRPYLAIAEELGLAEQEVIDRVRHLKDIGIIRRIGGNIVPNKLGYVSTLCAARVPEDAIENFTQVVNRYPGVTHNYKRDNTYNIWFTFIAPSMEDIEQHLKEISEQTGITEILNLPSTRVFKINAQFDV
jgi:DNA-binding Lrp family transcriptional regulator